MTEKFNLGCRIRNIRAMYKDMLNGYTVKCDGAEYWMCKSSRYPPNSGKEYIRVRFNGEYSIDKKILSFVREVKFLNKAFGKSDSKFGYERF